MKKLIIAEKKMVGDMIAKVVGARQCGTGFMEGLGYVVSWMLEAPRSEQEARELQEVLGS